MTSTKTRRPWDEMADIELLVIPTIDVVSYDLFGAPTQTVNRFSRNNVTRKQMGGVLPNDPEKASGIHPLIPDEMLGLCIVQLPNFAWRQVVDVTPIRQRLHAAREKSRRAAS